MSVKKITTILFSLRLGRMLIGILSAMVSAKFFGISIERDSWILAITVTTILVSAIWGPVNETFRTKFVYLKELEGKEKAIEKTSSLLGFIILSTFILCSVLYLFVDKLALYIIANPTEELMHIFIKIFTLLLPIILTNEISNILTSVLNAFEIFYLPEIVGTITSLINIIIVYCLAPYIGIYSFVLSTYVGTIIFMFVLIFFLKKNQIYVWDKLFSFKFSEAWKFVVFALPFFFPYFVGQCNTFFEKYLSGMLGVGLISSVEYARQFSSILQGVVNSVLTTIMVPMLSRAYITNEKSTFSHILKENFSTIFFIVGIALFYMIGTATPLCDFLFNKGSIDSEGLNRIVRLTQMFGFAFIGVILYIMTGMSLLASNKRKQYATIGVLTQIVVLGLNFALIEKIGVYTLPINYGLAHFITAIIMWAILEVEYKYNLTLLIARCVIIILCFSCFLLFVNTKLNIENSFVALIVSSIIILILLPLFAYGIGIDIRLYLNKIRQRL